MFTYQEALDYLYSFIDYGSLRSYRYSAETFDLRRMVDFMARLGDPQARYPTLHVAGTKGKGSACALMASALRAAGYRTGLYTSPHLQDFCERIQVDGEMIPRDDVAALVAEMRRDVEAVPGLTTFELNTALGFVYFARRKVDVAVVEVGLGGRLDATNVITPLVAVITSLSYDHMHLLGNTLAEIAGEKAGIIKPGVPVVSAPQEPEALAVIERVAAETGAPLQVVGRDWDFRGLSSALDGQRIALGRAGAPPSEFTLPLLGAHQVENAAVAHAALHTAAARGLHVPEAAIRSGFADVHWPGRFEVLSLSPAVIVDAAHNRDSARRLAAALDDYFPGRRVTLIFGASADKDVDGMFAELLPRVERVIATQAVHPRALDPDELLEKVPAVGRVKVDTASTVAEALEQALDLAAPDDVVLAAGSLFIVAEARAALAVGEVA